MVSPYKAADAMIYQFSWTRAVGSRVEVVWSEKAAARLFWSCQSAVLLER